MLSRSRSFMQVIHGKAKSAPKRIVLAEGDHPKIQRAAKILVEEGLATPILLSRGKKAEAALKARDVKSHIEVVDPETSPNFAKYAKAFVEKRKRHGVTLEDAERTMRFRNYFACMMVDQGDYSCKRFIGTMGSAIVAAAACGNADVLAAVVRAEPGALREDRLEAEGGAAPGVEVGREIERRGDARRADRRQPAQRHGDARRVRRIDQPRAPRARHRARRRGQLPQATPVDP